MKRITILMIMFAACKDPSAPRPEAPRPEAPRPEPVTDYGVCKAYCAPNGVDRYGFMPGGGDGLFVHAPGGKYADRSLFCECYEVGR